MSCVNLINACVVDLLAVQPNWFVSKCASKYSLNHREINFSAILAIEFVIAIGLISFSMVVGGSCLGSGVILEIFQYSGTVPCLMDELIMAQIGSQSIKARFLIIVFGRRRFI